MRRAVSVAGLCAVLLGSAVATARAHHSICQFPTVCTETPPPAGELASVDNPTGMQPLPPLSGGRLWPKVRGHLPYGYNAIETGHGMSLAEEVAGHVAIGASVARVTASWGAVRKYHDAWFLDDLDNTYRAYVKAGIRPLFVASDSPRRFTDLYTSFDRDPASCYDEDNNDNTWALVCKDPPRDESGPMHAFGQFVRLLATRYPLAAGIEIWNEPNLSVFWGNDPVSPSHYVSMLSYAYGWVRSVNSNIPVLGGSPNNPVSPEPFKDQSFGAWVDNIIAAGASSHMDALSYHPYATTLAEAGQLQDLIAYAYNSNGVPMNDRLVVTEMGLSEDNNDLDETTLAGRLRAQFELYDAGVEGPGSWLTSKIDGVVLHRQLEVGGNDVQTGYGFLEAKTAAGYPTREVWRTFCTQFGGRPSCPTVLQLP